MVVWRLVLVLCVSLGRLEVSSALEMVILHTNDMHARLDPVSRSGGACWSTPNQKCYGGFARIKAYADSVRRIEPNVLFLNAGDNYQGTPYFTVFRWKVMAPFIDALKMDVMSLGNHEFDDDVSGLTPYLRNVSTPSVCCNIDTSPEPSFEGTNLHPWKILKVENATVAVIGYLTPDTKFLAKTGRVEFRDEVESLQRASAEVRQVGADLVIALGHSGWETDLRIAREVDGVDLVIGGHTNTFLYTGTPPDLEVPVSKYPHIVTQRSGKKVAVAQAFAYTKYIGYMRLVYDHGYRLVSASGNPVLLDSTYPQDWEIVRMLNTWRSQMADKMKEKIGETLVDLIGDCRAEECNLGNIVTDAMVHAAAKSYSRKGEGWTDAPVAIVNGGMIRTTIPWNDTEGQITAAEALTALPFENRLLKVTVSGYLLKSILEHSVENYDITGINMPGSFLQMSGLKVTYDIARSRGDRVVRVLVRCGYCETPRYEPMHLNSKVTMVVNQFMAEGGDGYVMLKDETLPRENMKETDFSAFKEYLNQMSPIHTGVEGRITIFNRFGTNSGFSLSVNILILSVTIIIQFFR